MRIMILSEMTRACMRVACPFYKLTRKFTVPFCDNLVSGVPSCVVDEFYPDLDPYSFKSIDEYDEYMDGIKICSHFVRSDFYEELRRLTKSACYFGGLCVHPTVKGFCACSVDCPRFKK